MKKVIILSTLLIVALLNVLSCSPTVSQQEYDRVNSELSETRSELTSLQGKSAETETLQADYDRLSDNYSAVSNELETLQGNIDDLGVEYDELSDKYDDLSKQYDILMEEAIIAEEDIERALFELINDERRGNEIDELEWSRPIHSWALSHSQDMATKKCLEYSEDSLWQDVWMAAGYSSADRLASATMTIWKDSAGYEQNFLNKGAKISGVAAYKSGDIFYITYFARID